MRTRCSMVIVALVTLLSTSADAPAAGEGLADILAPDAEVKKLADGFKFVEGPTWDFKNQCLYFSDIPVAAIVRYQRGKVTIANDASGQSNGLMIDKDGKLVACEHAGRRVSRAEPGKPGEDIVTKYGKGLLNSPNDLWLDQHGGVYFTDPRYGKRDNLEQDVEAVYYLAADGKITQIVRDLIRPNGIALSSDGKMLYVVDNGANELHRYRIKSPGVIDKGEMIAEVMQPDGMTVDVKGRLYVTGKGGVWVLGADGKRLGIIETPEQPANCTFGGHGYQTLFVTARKSLYSIDTKTRGWHVHLDGVPAGDVQALRKARKVAAEKNRRIIQNNDGNDAREHEEGDPWTIENFLWQRTSRLVGSQVDSIFYCTGVFNFYSHRSDESELLSGDDKHKWAWSEKLIGMGTDTLELTIDFWEAHDVEVFWSMRMNDTHDSNSKNKFLMPKWKVDHPECLFSTPEKRPKYGGRRWSALNYELPVVRDKVLAILTDVCERYDVDGIELDFFRHPIYFKPQAAGEPVTQAQCDMMTSLVRRVREMTERVGLERGRPILVSIRVPDSMACAKEAIGLDVERWLAEGLVDIVAAGGYFYLEPWENLAAIGKKYDVPVYAVLSGSRMVEPGHPERQGDIEAWRGEALNAWEAGVDGIYTFNRFRPEDPIFRELGDPAMLKELDHTYEFNEGSLMNYYIKNGKRFLRKPESLTKPAE